MRAGGSHSLFPAESRVTWTPNPGQNLAPPNLTWQQPSWGKVPATARLLLTHVIMPSTARLLLTHTQGGSLAKMHPSVEMEPLGVDQTNKECTKQGDTKAALLCGSCCKCSHALLRWMQAGYRPGYKQDMDHSIHAAPTTQACLIRNHSASHLWPLPDS